MVLKGFNIAQELQNSTRIDSTMWKAEEQQSSSEFYARADQLDCGKNAG